MRQRQELTKTASHNQAALKAKLIEHLKDMGDDELVSDEESLDKDEAQQVAPCYPAKYFSKEEKLGLIKLREDRDIIKRKKKIIDSFNERKAALKQNLAA